MIFRGLFRVGLEVSCDELNSTNSILLSDVTPSIPTTSEEDAYEIEVFREYLRIPSVQPNVNYSKYRVMSGKISYREPLRLSFIWEESIFLLNGKSPFFSK